MSVQTTLHSGSFLDKEGNEIRITFSRNTVLNAQPSSFTLYSYGGTVEMSIWSRTGEANLEDPQCNWVTFDQIGAEDIPGCIYHKYNYSITVAENQTGGTRETDLRVDIEDGIGIGDILYVHITQYGYEPEI